jgi:hypothetical protein
MRSQHYQLQPNNDQLQAACTVDLYNTQLPTRLTTILLAMTQHHQHITS